MRSLSLSEDSTSRLNILCIGAHSDDIEIGCGGTILRLASQYPNSVFHWVVFSGNEVRAEEARRAAALFAGTNSLKGPLLQSFRDGFMPFHGEEVKSVFEELKTIFPDIVFTHNRNDAHQDHRFLAELTWNTFRDHFILEYEVPKYDGDMGRPSVFVPLDTELCKRKVQYLMDAFPSQRSKRWFQSDTFLSLLRLRGMECNAPSGYAEAFYCRKLTL
jgi:LmbE family N-acetylglucosaminyl deacetylase